MGCRNVKKALIEYASGDLNEQRRREIEAHLQGCTRCRTTAEKLEMSGQALSSLQPVRLSEVASSRILGAIAGDGKPGRSRRLGWLRSTTAITVAGVATALIVAGAVFIGIQVGDRSHKQETPTSTVMDEPDNGASYISAPPRAAEEAKSLDSAEIMGPPPTPVAKVTSNDYTTQTLREMFEVLEINESFGQRYTMSDAINLAPAFIGDVTDQLGDLGQDAPMVEAMISFITINEPVLLPCYVEKALFSGLDVMIIGLCAPPRSGKTTLLTRTEVWVMDPVRFETDPNRSIVQFLELK